ncbi:uncharacterized protein LOC134821887 [Bolinopsis microptera]|uniref:uncharacterized protein LOC134821887 n=1 Tax=Bolinopsis microptera TaxID=2820187 RepID=UPI00307A6E21
MNVLRFLVCFAAVSFQLSLVAAHDEEHEEEISEIGYVSYERQEYGDKIDGGVQLADFFRVNLEGSDLWETLESSDLRDFLVSLFMYDNRDKVWVEASAEKEVMEGGISVRKPLLGYDLLKSSGCEEKELKEQPFTKERWGFKEKEEVIPTCYLLTLSNKDQTASQMYPDNCVEDRTAKDKDLRKMRKKTIPTAPTNGTPTAPLSPSSARRR